MVKIKSNRQARAMLRANTNKQIDNIFGNMPNIKKQARRVTQPNLNERALKD